MAAAATPRGTSTEQAPRAATQRRPRAAAATGVGRAVHRAARSSAPTSAGRARNSADGEPQRVQAGEVDAVGVDDHRPDQGAGRDADGRGAEPRRPDQPGRHGDTGQRADEADGDADDHQVVGARQRDAADLEPVVGGHADDVGRRGQPEEQHRQPAAEPDGEDTDRHPDQHARPGPGRRTPRGTWGGGRCRPPGRPTWRQHRFGHGRAQRVARDAGACPQSTGIS